MRRDGEDVSGEANPSGGALRIVDKAASWLPLVRLPAALAGVLSALVVSMVVVLGGFIFVAALFFGRLEAPAGEGTLGMEEPETAETQRAVVKVERVVDANTIQLEEPFMFADRVELVGLDEPAAKDATAYAARSLEGREVEIEYDPERAEYEGEVYAYAWIDGELYQERALAEGFNRYVAENFSDADLLALHEGRLERAEDEAKAKGAGLWGSAPEGGSG